MLVEHLTEAQKRGLYLADNRLAMDAGWDDEMLALELENLKNWVLIWTLPTGFDLAEIDGAF